jgi:phytoene synthase
MLLLPERSLQQHSGWEKLRIIDSDIGCYRPFSYSPQKNEWNEDEWNHFNASLRARALKTNSEENAWKVLLQGARKILRNYSTSFFIVTRFLPPKKRRQVEAIYAAVRYPDEIMDTFPISPSEKIIRIDEWAKEYETALCGGSLLGLLEKGTPPIIAAFSRVVRDSGIPHRYYISFLEAMRLDAKPILYKNLNDLIDSYIYGSAIVVGYFLAYVYGSCTPADFQRALDASRDLGIALQLTNFMRDVSDDLKRMRLYIPLDMLERAKVDVSEIMNSSSLVRLMPVMNEILDIAENYYSNAQENTDAFSVDSRTAIQACIDVYRQLNRQIKNDSTAALSRHSVPLTRKFKILPNSKYWRLPAAYIFDF